jgi:hypothetical protein
MPINEEVIDVVANANLKSIAEMPAQLANLLYSNTVANINISQQNAVANQQAMNELGIAVVAKACHLLGVAGPREARSAIDIVTNEELEQTIADLKKQLMEYAPQSSEEAGVTKPKAV